MPVPAPNAWEQHLSSDNDNDLLSFISDEEMGYGTSPSSNKPKIFWSVIVAILSVSVFIEMNTIPLNIAASPLWQSMLPMIAGLLVGIVLAWYAWEGATKPRAQLLLDEEAELTEFDSDSEVVFSKAQLKNIATASASVFLGTALGIATSWVLGRSGILPNAHDLFVANATFHTLMIVAVGVFVLTAVVAVLAFTYSRGNRGDERAGLGPWAKEEGYNNDYDNGYDNGNQRWLAKGSRGSSQFDGEYEVLGSDLPQLRVARWEQTEHHGDRNLQPSAPPVDWEDEDTQYDGQHDFLQGEPESLYRQNPYLTQPTFSDDESGGGLLPAGADRNALPSWQGLRGAN